MAPPQVSRPHAVLSFDPQLITWLLLTIMWIIAASFLVDMKRHERANVASPAVPIATG